MPNRLGYCGGDDQRAMLDYYQAGASDGGLRQIMSKFQAAVPYLKLIAQENYIADPFDDRVVEAYWLGNELLEQVDLAGFRRSLHERFAGRLSPVAAERLIGKAMLGARAHHSFHVLEVWSRTGESTPDVAMLDSCRIGWGTVRTMEPGSFLIEARPVLAIGERLALGEPALRRIWRSIGGYDFLAEAKAGDSVSFHWDWACEIISQAQAQMLERYTRAHIELLNQRPPW